MLLSILISQSLVHKVKLVNLDVRIVRDTPQQKCRKGHRVALYTNSTVLKRIFVPLSEGTKPYL